MTASIVRRFLRLAVLVLAVGYGAAAGWTGAIDLDTRALAQSQGNVPGQALGATSDSELWRQVRRGDGFTMSSPGLGSGVLVQSQGENWRALRNGPISTYGAYFLIAVLVAIVAFFLIRGRVKVGAPTGRMVVRFSMLERMSHWAVAILFVLLGLTGLIILYGKYVLAPLIGAAGFASLASASLQAHNLLGPLFGLAIVVMLLVYLKDNIVNARDFIWLAKGGIFFRHGVPSGKYNFGEKTWFWIAILGGLAISVSGLYLDLPGLLEGSRETQQLANVVHGIVGLICIGAAIGHIYLGTVGVEGALDGMITGEVDEAWAEEHHSDWADEVKGQGGGAPSDASAKASPAE